MSGRPELNPLLEQQLEEILSKEEEQSPHESSGLAGNFYEKFYWKFVGVSSFGGGALLSYTVLNLMPAENSWSNLAGRTLAVGMSFIGGAAIGFFGGAVSGLAGAMLVMYWKDMAREFNKRINRYIF